MRGGTRYVVLRSRLKELREQRGWTQGGTGGRGGAGAREGVQQVEAGRRRA